MNKIKDFVGTKKKLENKYPGYTFETDTVYITPTTQKICNGCRKLIKDLRDHITCMK
jgi:hypothetical protein